MLKYDYGKYTFHAVDKNKNWTVVRYLDVKQYGYEPQKGIKIILKNQEVVYITNYWFDYKKADCDDKFKFECFERDLHRLMFLNEWTQDEEAFINKHYMPEEAFEKMKAQKQAVLDNYRQILGPNAEQSYEFRALASSFSLLSHKSLDQVKNELSEMASSYLYEMQYFDRMKNAQSLMGYEQNALELYGEPIDLEEASIGYDMETGIDVDKL